VFFPTCTLDFLSDCNNHLHIGDIYCISLRLQLSRRLLRAVCIVGAGRTKSLQKYDGYDFPIIYEADVRDPRVQLGEHDVRSHRDRHGTHPFRAILLWSRNSIAQQIFTSRYRKTAEVVAEIMFHFKP